MHDAIRLIFDWRPFTPNREMRFTLLFVFGFRCYRHWSYINLYSWIVFVDVIRQSVLDRVLSWDVLVIQAHGVVGVLLRSVPLSILSIPEAIQWMSLYIQSGITIHQFFIYITRIYFVLLIISKFLTYWILISYIYIKCGIVFFSSRSNWTESDIC